MITLTETGITFDRSIAKALAAFCPSTKKEIKLNPNYGIGLSTGFLCATDGHAVLQLESPSPQAAQAYNGRNWNKEQLTAASKLTGTSQPVTLLYADLGDRTDFPNVLTVMPPEQMTSAQEAIFEAGLLERVALVQTACGASVVRLTHVGPKTKPLRFDIQGEHHTATVLIMPARA